MNVVLAAHSREVKTALYLALNANPDVTVVATAASTAELVSYCRSFLPDAAIVESGLPGRSLPEVLDNLETSTEPRRILVIGGDEVSDLLRDSDAAEVLDDVGKLNAVLADVEAESENR